MEFPKAPQADAAQAERAIAAAKKAFPCWAALAYSERSAYLLRIADAIDARKEEFSATLTREQGKPLGEATYEIGQSIAALRFFAVQQREPKVLRETASERIVEQRCPQGVVAAIKPWNYPVLLLMYKIAAALVTGNP